MKAEAFRSRRGRGFTLVEMVVALAIMGVLMLAMGSVILVASKAIPSAGSTMVGATEASEAADRLASELHNAVRVLSMTDHGVTFTLADRNGDGVPERVSYSWSGTAGDPLVRTYNGHAATVVDSVGAFDLRYVTSDMTETYPGVGVESNSDELLSDYSSGSVSGGFGVSSSHAIAEYVCPQIPANAIGWRPTCVKLLASQGSLFSTTMLTLTGAGDDLKPGAVLGQQTLSSVNLLWDVYTWKTFWFSGLEPMAPGQGMCLELTSASFGSASDIAYDGSGGGGLEASWDGGSSWWPYADKSLLYQVYGRVIMPGADAQVSRRYLDRVAVMLSRSGADQPAVSMGVSLVNRPELDAGQWDLDFTSNPTAMDADANGTADWATSDGSTFDTSTLSGGVWDAGSSAAIQTQGGDGFTHVTTIEGKLEDTTVGGSGAMVSCVMGVSGGQGGVLSVSLIKQSNGEQGLDVFEVDSSGDAVRLLPRADLPAGMMDVRLLVDPKAQTVAVRAGGKDVGTVSYVRTSTSSSGYVAIGTNGDSGARFESMSVREVLP